MSETVAAASEGAKTSAPTPSPKSLRRSWRAASQTATSQLAAQVQHRASPNHGRDKEPGATHVMAGQFIAAEDGKSVNIVDV